MLRKLLVVGDEKWLGDEKREFPLSYQVSYPY